MPTLVPRKKPYQKMNILKVFLQVENAATNDSLDMAGQSSEQIIFLY